MDVQSCELVIESYAFNNQKVSLNWREWNPVSILSQRDLQYKVKYKICYNVFVNKIRRNFIRRFLLLIGKYFLGFLNCQIQVSRFYLIWSSMD